MSEASNRTGTVTLHTGSCTVRVHHASATHPGNVRGLNEDSVCVAPPVFAVADGMGGHDSGEVASALAAGAMSALASSRGVDPEALRRSVASANRLVVERSSGGARPMGTTLTGFAIALDPSPSVAVVNVGDSRTYCLADGVLSQMSKDHSEVQELVDAGHLTTEEAARHPARNVVTRALGVDPDVQADLFVHAAVVGQRWLACSDGLSGELDDRTIERILGLGTVAEAAANLVAAVLAGPARDNVSVVVAEITAIEVTDDPDRTDPRTRHPAPGDAAPAGEIAAPAGFVDAVPSALRATTPEPNWPIPREVIDGAPPGPLLEGGEPDDG